MCNSCSFYVKLLMPYMYFIVSLNKDNVDDDLDFGPRKRNNILKPHTFGSIFPTTPRQNSKPHPLECLASQIRHFQGTENSQMPRGLPGGMLKFRFDPRITSQNIW